MSFERAEAIIFGKLAERPFARFLVIRKPLQLLVGTPENPKIYRTQVLSIFPHRLDGPLYYGPLHFETINAVDGRFLSDMDATLSGRVEYKEKIPPLDKHSFTLAIATPSLRVPIRNGHISKIETMKQAPKQLGRRVALFSPDIILVANYDSENRLLYFETGSNWHSFEPDQTLLYALMQLFS